jgi:hypothetical protein
MVGSVDHHDLNAHRHPKPPFGGPSVDGESIGHQKGTAQDKVVFESVQKEVGVRLAPLLIRLLPCLFRHALLRVLVLALVEQRASKSATNTVHILLRARSHKAKGLSGGRVGVSVLIESSFRRG